MFTILLHSSKTMRTSSDASSTQQPLLMEAASELNRYLSSLSTKQIGSAMKLSPTKSAETKELISNWKSVGGLPAIDAFLGDIYSGLQVSSFSKKDRDYANNSLYILSGLYGVLRALDTIQPYRLEMGYRLPDKQFKNLYTFWASRIADVLPENRIIVNLSAVEYTKAVFPHLPESRRIISPKFLTLDPKTYEPKFIVVHAKIARGAFAHWLITNQIDDEKKLNEFSEIGYRFDLALSTPDEPVYICEKFDGIGMSVRLT